MKPAENLVDVLDNDGRIIGQKPRHEIDKRTDIFHSVHVVMMTPTGMLALSTIPQRDDLPNLYAGLLGTTMATIRCHDETAVQAARRGLKRELLIETGTLRQLRAGMVTLVDGRRNYLTAFGLVAPRPGLYRNLETGELTLIDPAGVDMAINIHADRFSPTLRAIWPSLKLPPAKLM